MDPRSHRQVLLRKAIYEVFYLEGEFVIQFCVSSVSVNTKNAKSTVFADNKMVRMEQCNFLTLIPPTATIVLSQCLPRIGTKSFSCVSKRSRTWVNRTQNT